jgi:hypothetical protein
MNGRKPKPVNGFKRQNSSLWGIVSGAGGRGAPFFLATLDT